MSSPELEQREYQIEAVKKVLDAFMAGKESVLLESPVGSGKTIMGLMVVQRLQEVFHEEFKVNWVATRRHILQQTRQMNETWFNLKLNTVSVFDPNPPQADLVILDEAHHEATQSCLNLYEKVRNKRTLGLSATPLRTDKMRLSFQTHVHTTSIQRLIDEDVLADFYSYKIDDWKPESVAQIFCQYQEQWGKSLVFFHTINECEQFRDLLAVKDIPCEVITSKTNRDEQLEQFVLGAFPVIANVNIFCEGFDLPELRTVFIRDASRLPTIQMAGRGLRKSASKDHCNFIQSQLAPYQVEKIAKPERSFVHRKNVWLSRSGDTQAIVEALEKTEERLRIYEEEHPVISEGKFVYSAYKKIAVRL